MKPVPTLVKSMRIGAGTLTHSGLPTVAVYEDLRPCALDCWWNLAEELGDLVPEMEKVAREVLWGKVRDFCPPDDVELFEHQLERVCALLRGGGRVHVSCFGGIGRTGWHSPASACALLVRRRTTRWPRRSRRAVGR